MRPRASEMALRTGTTSPVTVTLITPAATTAALRRLAPPLVGTVPTLARLTPPSVVLTIWLAIGPVPVSGLQTYTPRRASYAATVVQTRLKPIRRLPVTPGRPTPRQLTTASRPKRSVRRARAGATAITSLEPVPCAMPTVVRPRRTMKRAATAITPPLTDAIPRTVQVACTSFTSSPVGEVWPRPRPRLEPRRSTTIEGPATSAGLSRGLTPVCATTPCTS